jgi:hypothetical protein
MKKEERQAIITEDFKFLDDITIHTVDGKLMLGNNNLPFNVATVLRESDFVKNWMMPFALGNDLGTNYFNIPKWLTISNRGTQAVMVVNDDDEPVLLVRPLISHNLTPRDFDLLRNVSRHIQQIQADTQRSKDPNASMGAATAVKEHLEAKRLTITDLVSPEFFERHGIIPEVEKKVYYIKDEINQNTADIKDINRSRDILYRDHKRQKVTPEEYRFLETLSKGQFIIEDKVSQQALDQTSDVEPPSNPLEC